MLRQATRGALGLALSATLAQPSTYSALVSSVPAVCAHPAQAPGGAEGEPRHIGASRLMADGMALEAWGALLDALLSDVSERRLDDLLTAAHAEVDARMLLALTRELEAGPLALARLEQERPWPEETPAQVAFLLEYTYGECLRNAGETERARAVFDALGYLRDWLLVGPFDNERGVGMTTAYPPEQAGADVLLLAEPMPGKVRDVRWRANPGVHHALGRIVLHEVFRPDTQVVAYLTTAIQSEADQDVVLNIGSSGPLAVSLNGEPVFESSAERPFGPDQDRVVLPLVAGWNRVLLKVGVEDGAWVLETRLTDSVGRPLLLPSDSSLAGLASPPARQATIRLPLSASDVLASFRGDGIAQLALAQLQLLAHPHDYTSNADRLAAQAAVDALPGDGHAAWLLTQALYPENKSRSEMSTGPYQAALERVLELDPGHIPALLASSRYARTILPLPDRADEVTGKALGLAPRSWAVSGARAQVLQDQGREVEADELLRSAARYPEGQLRRAGIRQRVRELDAAGERAEAFAIMEEEFRRRPMQGTLTGLYLRELHDQGRTDELLAAVSRVLAGTPFSVEFRLDAASLLEYSLAPPAAGGSSLSAARALVEEALLVCPESQAARRHRARLLERQGDLGRALEELNIVLELEPGDDAVRRRIAWLTRGEAEKEEEERFEDPWRSDAAELVGSTFPAGAANYVVDCLDRTSVYRIYPDGGESRYEHVVYRPLNPRGVEALDSYGIVYPRRGSLYVHQVRIIRPDGSIERAPAPQRADYTQGALAMRLFDLPPVKVGDLVDVEFRVDETEPDVFGEYFGTRHMFYPDRVDALAPTRRSELVVLAPEELPVYVATRNADDIVYETSRSDAGETVHSWVVHDLQRPAQETAMPKRVEFAPVVDVTTYPDWETFGRWWRSFIEKEFDTSPEMEAKVAELTTDLADERDKIEAIVRFVGQEIRYNAWAFGTHGYEPFSASTIFERRFGDCKDKSILLCQMLAMIGVDAEPVLIKAEARRPDESLEAARVGAFNHCIAYLTPTDDRDGLYVDATADRNPLDYLRYDDQGARVLHVGREQSVMREIVYSPPEENSLVRSYVVELAPDGSGRVRMRDDSNGAYGVRLRYRYGGERDDIQKALAAELVEAFGQVQIESVETGDLEDIGQPAWLEAHFGSDKLWTAQGGGRALSLCFDPLGLDGIAVEPESERVFPIVLDRPQRLQSTVRWVLPPGFEVGRVPEDLSVEVAGILRYTTRVTQEQGSLTVERVFELAERRIPLSEYTGFKNALRDILIAEQRSVQISGEIQGEGR